MRRYGVLFLFLLLGCSIDHHIKLAGADSLLIGQTDSSYKFLQEFDRVHLSEKDRAYHSLLLTTAQYKLFIPIESDSLIAQAVAYYTDHYDQRKLTRALLYRGAVLDELGFSKGALECYKQAEHTVDTADYSIIGLLNYRLGEFYQRRYADNEEHIARYKKALTYYIKANDGQAENYTLSRIGQLYRERNIDSAHVYLDRAIALSTIRKDTVSLKWDLATYAEFLNHTDNFEMSKNIALYAIRQFKNEKLPEILYPTLSKAYSRLKMVDSAIYYANRCYAPISIADTLRLQDMWIEISLAHNDYKKAYALQTSYYRSNDSVIMEGRNKEYYQIDKEFDHRVAIARNHLLESKQKAQHYWIGLLVLSCSVLVVGIIVFLQRKRTIIKEKNRDIDRLQSAINHLESDTSRVWELNLKTISNLNKTIAEKAELEQSLKQIIADRMQVMRSLMTIKYQFEDHPEKFFKQFDAIMSVNKKSRTECDAIIHMANQLQHNVVDHIAELHPELSYGDKLLVSLLSLDFSAMEMKIFLGSPNMEATYAARYRLNKKLKTSSLEKYIEDMKKELSALREYE